MKNILEHCSDMLYRMKLLASEVGSIPKDRKSFRCMKVFEAKIGEIDGKILPVIDHFQTQAKLKVTNHLTPALKSGLAKGREAALTTVRSWDSKCRRTKNNRPPEFKGLHWNTYYATIRRDGVYASATAGLINMNQELYDPMEKEFSREWQQTMDRALGTLIAKCEADVENVCLRVNQAVQDELSQQGIDEARLIELSTAASRGCTNCIKASFGSMRKQATSAQRTLSRSVLPMIEAKMQPCFDYARNTERGPGSSYRIKSAIQNHIKNAENSMFSESYATLLHGIEEILGRIVKQMLSIGEAVAKQMKDVYSIYWDDQDESEKAFCLNPETKQKVRECRNQLLPRLNQLQQIQNEALELVGLEREEVELEILGVESFENGLSRKLDEAATKGEVVDLCHSDEEESESMAVKLPPTKPIAQVKEEQDTSSFAAADI